MSYPIRDIGCIDEAAARGLRKAGIRTTEKLLDAAKDPKGRKALAEATGLDEKFLLHCANTADRLRVKGLGKGHATLMHEAGVDTVRELKHRNAKRLAEAMAKANKKRQLVKFNPNEEAVQRWIEEARTLPLKIRY
jgi:hypothetical protein